MELVEKNVNTKKLWLTGIGSITPYAIILYTIVFISFTAYHSERLVPNESLGNPQSVWFIIYTVLIGAWLLSSLILTAYYIFDIFKNERIPEEKRIFWLLMILLLNSLSFIAYWKTNINPGKVNSNKSLKSFEGALEQWKLVTALNSDVRRTIRIKLWITGIGSCLPFISVHLLLFTVTYSSITDKLLSSIHPDSPLLVGLPIIWLVIVAIDLFLLPFYFLYDLAFFRDDMDKMQKTAWGFGLLFGPPVILPSYWYNVVYKRLTIDQDNY